MMRGGRAVVISPNVLLPPWLSGLKNWPWLKALKNSERNSSDLCSPMGVFLLSDKSKLLMPGPRSELRGNDPKVKIGTPAGLRLPSSLYGEVQLNELGLNQK